MSDCPTNLNPAPTSSPTEPLATDALPPTSASAVRMARIGGTVAEAAAAAISAHTLYHLGGQLDLGPWTAWLLPAALDVYAFTALATGYSLPVNHPGQRHVLRNARLAFAMTLGCNFLDHFLTKAGRLVDPTVRDLLLVAVATLPPLVVERLLNLQSLLAGYRPTPTTYEIVDQVGRVRSDRPVSQGALAQVPHPVQAEVGGRPHVDPPEATAGHTAMKALIRPDWTAEGAAVFADLFARLGRRPSAREFQQVLAAQTRTLIADGRLAAGARPPSITTAKRVRAALEAVESSHSGPPSASQLVQALPAPAADRSGEGQAPVTSKENSSCDP